MEFFIIQVLLIINIINESFSRFVDQSLFSRNEVNIEYIPNGRHKNDALFSSNFTIIKYMSDDEKNKLNNTMEYDVSISAIVDSADFSFYNQLDAEEKKFYDIIYSKSSQTIPELEIDVLITDIDTDLQTYYNNMYYKMEKIFTALVYENPELWWIGDILFSAYQGDEYNSLIFTFYIVFEGSNFGNYSKEEISNLNQEIKNEGERIVNKIKKIGLTSQYSILRYIHDYLITKNVYTLDESLKHIRTLYGGLVDGICVCEGYAEAFQYLARLFDINCIIARSYTHEWNFVEINEKWYILDATYDDPSVYGMDLSSGKNDNLQLEYFLTGTEHESQLNYPKYTEDSSHTLMYTAYNSGNTVVSYPSIEKKDYVPSEEEKRELSLIDFTFSDINSSGIYIKF